MATGLDECGIGDLILEMEADAESDEAGGEEECQKGKYDVALLCMPDFEC